MQSLVCPDIADRGLLALRRSQFNHTESRRGWDGLGSHSPGITSFILSLLRTMAAIDERTFIAIKPDGVQRGLVGEIIQRFEKKGFKLVAMKLIHVSSPQLLCLLFYISCSLQIEQHATTTNVVSVIFKTEILRSTWDVFGKVPIPSSG